MQWLSADIVFDGYDFHTDFYLQIDEGGKICQIQNDKPKAEVEHYQGLLMPGMVNAHCHLELSHTKGMIAEKTGLSTFLQEVSKVIPQKIEDQIIQQAILQADASMQQNGIIAVGDICNTAKTIRAKVASTIHYHNFIECIAIRKSDVKKRFADYKEVYNEFIKDLETSYTLHTPYTCHADLYELVSEHSNFISIHNQESAAENQLFEEKEGEFDNFYKHFGLDKSEIVQADTERSSFKNSQRLLNSASKKLFVHNTFTRKEDLESADDNSWFCFCPKANLYIENQLPNIPIFLDFQNQLVLGTDSLASNDALSILAEAKTIHDNFPDIPLKNILQWATINGARLFGIENKLGSFEIGKNPGIVQVKIDNGSTIKLDCLVKVIR